MFSARDPRTVIEKLGKPGKYAKLIFGLVVVNISIVSMNHLSLSVLAASSDFWCPAANNSTTNQTRNTCDVSVNSTHEEGDCPGGWVYDNEYKQPATIVEEWDLVCGATWQLTLSSSLYYGGVMIGSLGFGTLSDRYGRRPVLLATLLSSMVPSMILIFVDTFIAFSVLRSCIGFCMEGTMNAVAVMSFELFHDDHHRAFTAPLLQMCFASGILVLALFAYIFRTWRNIQIAITVWGMLPLFFIWFIPESLRWLLMNNRHSATRKYLKKAAAFNKVAVPHHEAQQNNSPTPTTHVPFTNILKLFKPELRRITFLICYARFTADCCYYLLMLQTSDLYGDRFVNFFLNGAITIGIACSAFIVLSRLGRRQPLAFYFFLSGISLILAEILLLALSDLPVVSVCLSWIGRVSIIGVHSIIILYPAELFPTVVRNTGVGAGSFSARLGAVLAPQLILMSSYIPRSVPAILAGCLAILAGCATLGLPETKGKQLTDNIQNQGEEADRNLTKQSANGQCLI